MVVEPKCARQQQAEYRALFILSVNTVFFITLLVQLIQSASLGCDFCPVKSSVGG